MLKPNNFSDLDSQNIANLNVEQKTLHCLVGFEQKTFVDEKVITKIEPNNIYNFIIRNNKIRILKNRFDSNICAKIFKENSLIDEIFADNLSLLIEKLNFYCIQQLNIEPQEDFSILT